MSPFASRQETPRGVDTEQVLDVLADADCRAMLAAADDARTASEFVDEFGLASSTAYRKLDRLVDAGLFEERTRVDADGNHATEYCRAFDAITLSPDAAGDVGVDVEWSDRDEASVTSQHFAFADD